jgi:hypothetical protein
MHTTDGIPIISPSSGAVEAAPRPHDFQRDASRETYVGNGPSKNQHFSFVGKEPISATAEAVRPHDPKLDAPSPEPVQASDLTLISGTRCGSPLSASVSGSNSLAIDPTTLESGGIWEGHQSNSKTSST